MRTGLSRMVFQNNINELIEKITPVLKELTVPNSEEVSQKEWNLGVPFEEDLDHVVDLYKIRNQKSYKNRFALDGIPVCYLAKCFIRIENEIRFIGTSKKITIHREPKLLNFNLGGPVNSLHIQIMKEKEMYDDIKALLYGPRNEENYKNSCILATHIFKNDFDGIYFSPHPDAKHKDTELERLALSCIRKTTQDFSFQDALGPYSDPMLVIFEREGLLSFANAKVQANERV